MSATSDEEELTFAEEAHFVANEIRFAVKDVNLRIENEKEASFTIITLEGQTLEVRLGQDGFQVVNQQNSNAVYETINALLDTYSPKYREAFANALASKLNDLANS